jgi:hypothetical protein
MSRARSARRYPQVYSLVGAQLAQRSDDYELGRAARGASRSVTFRSDGPDLQGVSLTGEVIAPRLSTACYFFDRRT